MPSNAHEKLCDARGLNPHIADIGKILKSTFMNGGFAAFRKIIQFQRSSQSLPVSGNSFAVLHAVALLNNQLWRSLSNPHHSNLMTRWRRLHNRLPLLSAPAREWLSTRRNFSQHTIEVNFGQPNWFTDMNWEHFRHELGESTLSMVSIFGSHLYQNR